MNPLAIDVRDLSKTFNGKKAVNNVTIQQPEGSVWGFLGPNGSGKTTCIRMLCGLLLPDCANGHCLGFDIQKQAREIKNRTGYMTQKFSFWEDLTVRENLDFVARLYQLPQRKKLVAEQLENLGLTQRQNELTAGLSGGWKQRLALAAVTMHHPKLLLLDEPTAGVDPQARRTFWQAIHQLSQQGLTVLVSTHYMDEAERCDHIVYLVYGHILTQGTSEEIIQYSGLSARCTINQGEIRQYLPKLQNESAILSATYYGGQLHVTGKNALALDKTLQESYRELTWVNERPTLDDAFIALEIASGGDKR